MKNKKSIKNWIWEGLGLHLGGVWDGLGRLLGTFGRFLAVLGVFYIILFSNMGQHGPKMSSKRPLASILGRFWKGLGRILEGFGKVLEDFLKLFYVKFAMIFKVFGIDFGRIWSRFVHKSAASAVRPLQYICTVFSFGGRGGALITGHGY